jgi:hypothetical protein
VELAKKLNALEKKYDRKFKVVFEAIRELMTPEPSRATNGLIRLDHAAATASL